MSEYQSRVVLATAHTRHQTRLRCLARARRRQSEQVVVACERIDFQIPTTLPTQRRVMNMAFPQLLLYVVHVHIVE